MHSIERYGIVALIFLVVTVVAVLVWDGDKAKKKKELAPLNATTATAPLVAGSDEGAKLVFAATPEPGPLVRTPHGVRGESDSSSAPLAGAETPIGGAPALNPGATPGLTPPAKQGFAAGNTGSALSSQGSALQNDPQDQEPREQPALDRPIAAAPNAAVGSTHTYLVRSGDTLSAIALSQLGSSKRWQEIIAANPGLEPSKLRVGKTIQLPGAAGAQKATTAKSDPKTGDTPSTVAKNTAANSTVTNKTAANPADAKSTGSWKVGSGENLWRIAERALGDGKRWGEIAALNPSVNPDKLVLGQLLKLPAAPASTTRGADKTSSVKTAAKGAPQAAKNSATLVASASRSEQNRSGGKVK